ncbi:DUF2169 family type VI secretion system accessory protein [Polyangium fumosum]|uniref:DUF2169 domain-containing protein n=1 Tax=Polyangium fumosum TaxID=889272 RepID=A0A4U1INS1_9BACT|nr:DUF2169 domain-containing protein [Polyangium fumosum]TKC95744.1 DUF2169 domain-containing protein [Polyangium fumosum]
MEIVRLCPFSVATVVWEERPGGYRLTIGVKATFTLVHGETALLAPRQDTAHGDISWDHNPQAALFAPSDFVPYKPKIDVAFSGRAFAPGGMPAEVLTPRLRVGHFEKSLRVCGPRIWMPGHTGSLRPSAPERFSAIPLRYELAVMQGENMSGIPSGGGSAGWPLPRIETSETCPPNATPGFGPLPIRWRAEHRGAPDEAVTFARRIRSEHATAPASLPFSLFNCAPSEQQIDELEPAPSILLEHLTRKAPRFESRLPNIRPRVFYAHRGSVRPFEIDVRLDTIWIDGVRLVAVLSWRGSTSVPEPDEHALGRIIVASESPEMTVSLEDVESPPVAPEDSSPRPILPRPFEGEIAEDEGYTLLPSAPAQHAPEEPAPLPVEPLALGGSLPARPRDSSVPIPPSGERLIEDRASSRFVVDAAFPGPSQLVERAARAEVEDERPAQVETSVSWEADVWPGDAAAMRLPPPPTSTSVPQGEQPRGEEEEDPADRAPATARTGTTSPPPAESFGVITERESIAPPTLVPSTRKTGTLAPPPTLPGGSVAASARLLDAPPTTQRAPALLSWSEPTGYMPAAGTASTTTASPVSPAENAAFFTASAVVSSGPALPSAPATPSPKPSVVSVETPRPSGAGRRPSTSSMAAPLLMAADLPLELCACVAARIDRRPEDRARILSEMGLSDPRWVSTERTWVSAIRAETEQGRSELRLAYDRAYVQQLEIERGALEIADYARLMFSVEHSDADVVLAELGLARVCLVRIERVWQERMEADPAFRARVREALASARRAYARVSPDGRSGATYAEAATPSRPRSSDR